jgi:hypothetical protein
VDANGHNNPRQVLACWRDRLVVLTGVLDRLIACSSRGRSRFVALVQDCEVELPDGSRHYLGHLHLQNSEGLRGFDPGQRLRCRCAVRSYFKQPPGGAAWRDWSLAFPRDVQALPGPIYLQTVQEAPPPNGGPPFLVPKLRALVRRAGGAAALVGLLDAAAAVGWDVAADALELADQADGLDRLRRLIYTLEL